MTTIEEQLKNYVEEGFERESRNSRGGDCSVNYNLTVLIVDDMKYVVSCRFFKSRCIRDDAPHFNISVTIIMSIEEEYRFDIPHCDKHYKTVETIELETITGLLNHARTMINNVKYDKLYNKLIVDDNAYVKSNLDSSMVEFMTMGSNRVKSNYDECCVCNEFTYAKTQCCKGTLCLPCLLKIKGVEDEDGLTNIPCPLCRENLKDYDC
jgi:hypothetical protein